MAWGWHDSLGPENARTMPCVPPSSHRACAIAPAPSRLFSSLLATPPQLTDEQPFHGQALEHKPSPIELQVEAIPGQ
jgi:hypothetical protein